MPTIKLVVIGASGVGKTSLRGKYISGRFSNGYRATIGADFITKTLPHPSHSDPDQSVTLQIWDTAGQERFSSLSTAFFRGADAVLLMFDVNTPETMFALKKWWNDFRYQAPVADEDVEEYPCVVVGNKIDMVGTGGTTTSIGESEALVFLEELIPSSSIHIIPPAPEVDDEDATSSHTAQLPAQSPPSNPQHEPAARSDSITINSSNNHSRQPSYSPNHQFTKSRSRSSSRFYSGTMTTTHTTLSIYHTPSSSVFDLYQSAQSSPEPPWLGSEPTSPSASVRRKRRLAGLSTGSTSSGSAVTITPSLFARSTAASATGATTPEAEQGPTLLSSSLGLRAPPPDRGPKLFLTSAKTGQGVEGVFEYITRRVMQKWEYEDSVEARRLGFREASAVEETVRLGLGGLGSGGRERNGWDGCCSS